MPIYVKNIHYYQKTGKGHMLKTSIESMNLSQFESDIVRFLNKKNYTATTKVGKTNITISNIKDMETGKRASSDIYAKLRGLIATSLEKRNMIGTVVGGHG